MRRRRITEVRLPPSRLPPSRSALWRASRSFGGPRKPDTTYKRADLPPSRLRRFGEPRRSLGGGGKVRLYVRSRAAVPANRRWRSRQTTQVLPTVTNRRDLTSVWRRRGAMLGDDTTEMFIELAGCNVLLVHPQMQPRMGPALKDPPCSLGHQTATQTLALRGGRHVQVVQQGSPVGISVQKDACKSLQLPAVFDQRDKLCLGSRRV